MLILDKNYIFILTFATGLALSSLFVSLKDFSIRQSPLYISIILSSGVSISLVKSI